MTDPYEAYLDAPAQAPVDKYEAYLGPEKPSKTPVADRVKDIGRSFKAGVEELPGIVTGLADIAPALAFGATPFSKAADWVGEQTGFQPGKWAKETQYSQAHQQSQAAIDQAWNGSDAVLADPATSKADYARKLIEDAPSITGAYLKNPMYTLGQVAQSLPASLAGGVVSRPLMLAGRAAPVAEGLAGRAGYLERAVGEKMAAPVAGGIGEGTVQTGQAMSQSEGPDARKNALAALGSGAADALIATGAGRLANRLGLETHDTALAKIGDKGGAAELSLPRRVLGGAASEALLQELPQSMQEQAFQNYADGKPLMEGVVRQGLEGAVSGGVMGAAFNLPGGSAAEPPATPAESPTQPEPTPPEPAEPQNVPPPQAGGPPSGTPQGEVVPPDVPRGAVPPLDAAPVAPVEAPGGDPLRAHKLPDAGPLSAAVNAGVESEAQAADVGRPVEAPISAALAGIAPPAQALSKEGAAKPAAKPELSDNGAEAQGASSAQPGSSQVGATSAISPSQEAGNPVGGTEQAGNQSLAPAVFTPAGPTSEPPAIPGAVSPERALDRLRAQAGNDQNMLRQWDKQAEQRPELQPQAGDVLDSQGQPFKNLFGAKRALAKQPIPDEMVPVAVSGGYALRPVGVADKPAEAQNAQRTDSALAATAGDAGGNQPARSAGDVGTAPAQPAGGVPAAAAAPGAGDGSAVAVDAAGAVEPPSLKARRAAYQAANAPAAAAEPPALQPVPESAPSAAPAGPADTAAAVAAEPGTADATAGLAAERVAPTIQSAPSSSSAPDGFVSSPVDDTSPMAAQPDTQAQAQPADTSTSGPRGTPDGGAIETPEPAPSTTRNDATETVTQRHDLTGEEQSVVDAAAHAAATSPTNDLPEPTQSQKEAGNYKVGRVNIAGLDISIENPQGSVRKGVDKNGKPWENELQHHYGYIRGTVGNDKDHVDAFVKPGTSENHQGPVFVVDQVHPETGKFDEHKALVGFNTLDEAKTAYAANYAADWQGMKSITEMPVDEFKTWVKNGPKTKPLVPLTLADRRSAAQSALSTELTTEAPAERSAAPTVQPAEGIAPVVNQQITTATPGREAAEPTAPPVAATIAQRRAKVPTKTQRAEQERDAARADYFAPGNVVTAYGGHDRVIAYTPPDENGRWSVKARRVVKQGDTWIDDPKDNRERQHSTQPDERALRAGPVVRAAAKQAPDVRTMDAQAVHAEPGQPAEPATPAVGPKVAGLTPTASAAADETPAASRTAATGMAHDAVQAEVDRIKAGWQNAPEVVIVDSLSDPRVHERVRQEDTGQRKQGATGEPAGFAYRGTVYLVAPQLKDAADVRTVLMHEALGHVGLRGVFGKELGAILDGVANMRGADIAALAKTYGKDVNNAADRRVLAEEVLANMAQTTPSIGFVQRAIAAIRTWLRQHGFKVRLSDAELIRDMIEPARKWVQQGRRGAGDAGDAGAAPPAFSRANPAGSTVKAITALNLKTATKRLGNKLADYRGLLLYSLGRRQLVDLYAKDIPSMTQYSGTVDQMDADKNGAGASADKIATDWGKLPDEAKLADLMHDATIEQMDADPNVPGDASANVVQLGALRARFKALSPQAQETYRTARDAYAEHWKRVHAEITARINRAIPASARRTEMLLRMDAEFFKAIKGVYFPLSRFGDYVITAKRSDGTVASVARAETMNEADATRKAMVEHFKSQPSVKVSKVLKSAEFNAGRDMVSKGFVNDLFNVLEESGASDDVYDSINQLYLDSLPDLSWAKHGIHRKGTPGYSQNARRAFAQNMFHGARYLAKLRYSDVLQDALTQMQKHVDEQANVEGYDSVRAQQVVDEMVKRHESLMNPKTNALSTALTSLGFVFHLGMSPASAITNLAQTAMVAYPLMGAKWGFSKSSGALLTASRQAAANRNDMSKVLKGDERRAFDKAVEDGVLDVTQSHDLVGIAQGEDDKVLWKIRPVMRAASFMFHHAEKFNRQVTFMAAYRLAREAGQIHQMAYEDAVRSTYDGHFNYSASNRPRVMQGNAARVLLLFKQFGQNMIYTLMRQAQLSLKGATPAERTEARKALSGLLVMHAAGAGLLGLPLVTTLLAAASMFGGDEDEPWDAEVALRNMLADTFGTDAGEVMAHGLSRLTPWDVSGRVGLSSMILPDLQEGLQGQRLGESAMAAALGPVAGIGINVLKGVQDISEGRVGRGIETLLPAALRGPMRAYRYATEGAVDKTGVVIKDDVGPAGIAGQALGLSPSEVREAQEARSAIYSADHRIMERRKSLTAQYAMAVMAGDEEGSAAAREEISAFNEKQPERAITGNQLLQGVRNRMKRIEQASEGVYLPAKRRNVMEQGRFAREVEEQ